VAEGAKSRRAVKQGYYTVPDDPGEPPRLLGTHCKDCDEYFFPTRLVCAKCLSQNTEDAMLGPKATLYSYTFVHFPLFGSTRVEHASGYGVGQVDLPEGPRVQMPLAGKQEEFKVGMPLMAELEPIREDGEQEVVILRFRPLAAGEVA
jgi:uncharacterized OB-fold protein